MHIGLLLLLLLEVVISSAIGPPPDPGQNQPSPQPNQDANPNIFNQETPEQRRQAFQAREEARQQARRRAAESLHERLREAGERHRQRELRRITPPSWVTPAYTGNLGTDLGKYFHALEEAKKVPSRYVNLPPVISKRAHIDSTGAAQITKTKDRNRFESCINALGYSFRRDVKGVRSND